MYVYFQPIPRKTAACIAECPLHLLSKYEKRAAAFRQSIEINSYDEFPIFKSLMACSW